MNARSAALGFMAALGLLLPALGQAQPSFAKTLQFWKNKGFVDRFMATYGVKSEVEPKISADENDQNYMEIQSQHLKMFLKQLVKRKNESLNRRERKLRVIPMSIINQTMSNIIKHVKDGSCLMQIKTSR